MQQKPLISVIIPTYNRRDFITKAIDSIFAQGAWNTEIIVIDDGSSDDTANLLEPYKHAIHYIYQENRGVSAARNRGVAESRGEYLAFLDSDDEWVPSKLEAQFDLVSEGVLSFGGVEWFVDGQEDRSVSTQTLGVKWPRYDASGYIIDPVLDVAEARYLTLGTLLCTRSTFLSVGPFDESLCAGEDEDWFSRASLKLRFRYAPGTFLRIRFHPHQTSLESERSLRSLICVFARMKTRTEGVHPRAHAIANKRLAAKWSHLANRLKMDQRWKEAGDAARTAYLFNPFNLKRLVKAVSYR
jgi:glycosyltransferase involved in cell wall biosynthesis